MVTSRREQCLEERKKVVLKGERSPGHFQKRSVDKEKSLKRGEVSLVTSRNEMLIKKSVDKEKSLKRGEVSLVTSRSVDKEKKLS